MQQFLKKNIQLLAAILMLVTVISCSSQDSPQSVGIDGWQIDLLKFEITDDLSSSKTAMQYSGDAVEIEYNQAPEAGNTYVLIKLLIEKTESGASQFKWDNVTILDENGNKFNRHENDTFLEKFSFPRLKSTDLTFGSNEGYACFEIPLPSADGSLSLVYSGQETVEIKIK